MIDAELRNQFVSLYSALNINAQKLFLFRLGHYITLVGRDTYDTEGGVVEPVRLRAVNEAMHRLLSHLGSLSLLDERRYPDDVFANLLVDYFNMMDLDPTRVMHYFDDLRNNAE